MANGELRSRAGKVHGMLCSFSLNKHPHGAWSLLLNLLSFPTETAIVRFFWWFIQNLMFYWFLIYAAPHHLVAACLSIEQLLKICGDSDHADPRPETVGQPRIDDLAEILFLSS